MSKGFLSTSQISPTTGFLSQLMAVMQKNLSDRMPLDIWIGRSFRMVPVMISSVLSNMMPVKICLSLALRNKRFGQRDAYQITRKVSSLIVHMVLQEQEERK